MNTWIDDRPPSPSMDGTHLLRCAGVVKVCDRLSVVVLLAWRLPFFAVSVLLLGGTLGGPLSGPAPALWGVTTAGWVVLVESIGLAALLVARSVLVSEWQDGSFRKSYLFAAAACVASGAVFVVALLAQPRLGPFFGFGLVCEVVSVLTALTAMAGVLGAARTRRCLHRVEERGSDE